MDNLRNIGGLGKGMDTFAKKAEFQELLRLFREEEKRNYRTDLLLGGEKFGRTGDARD